MLILLDSYRVIVAPGTVGSALLRDGTDFVAVGMAGLDAAVGQFRALDRGQAGEGSAVVGAEHLVLHRAGNLLPAQHRLAVRANRQLYIGLGAVTCAGTNLAPRAFGPVGARFVPAHVTAPSPM